MGRKTTDKQFNLTMAPELFDELSKFCSDNGMSVSEFLRQAANSAMLQDRAALLPEQTDAIDQFQLHMTKLIDAYKMALDAAANSYDIARDKVRDQLKALDTLTDTVDRQRAELEKKQSELETAKDRISRQEDTIQQLRSQLQEVGKSSSDTRTLQAEILDLKQALADSKARHAEEIARIHKENMDNIVRILRELRSDPVEAKAGS